MEAQIIKIGNSKGLRLSKTVLEKYNIRDRVELILENEHIIMKPIATPREGWEASAREMRENGDDHLLIDDVFGDESFEEWT